MIPTTAFWWRLFMLLAIEAALVTAVAAVLTRWIKSAVWRRTIWQAGALGLLVLAACDSTGLSRGFAAWVTAKPEARSSRRFVVQTFPANLNPAPPSASDDLEAAPELQPASVSAANSRSRTWWPGLIWLVGFGLMAGRSGLARFVFLLVSHRRRAVTDELLLARVRELSGRMGIRRRVRMTESNGLSGPVALGLFRPAICLPARFASDFTAAQQDAMLAHELAHVAARDPAWYWLGDLAAALWWWHPLAWWTRSRLQVTSEQAADEASLLVENGPDSLAECLLEVGRRLTRPQSFGRLGIEGNGFRSGLGQRVARLLELSGDPWREVGQVRLWLARAAGLAALALITLAGAAWTSPPRGETFQQNWQGSLAGYVWNAFSKPSPKILLAQAAPPSAVQTTQEAANHPGRPAIDEEALDSGSDQGPLTLLGRPAISEEALHTGWFKVDPNMFAEGLRVMLGTNSAQANSTNAQATLSIDFRSWMEATGVDLSPPKSLFYNDRLGQLMVRATLQDLEVIEQVVQILNTPPAQVSIEVRFAEVPEDENGGSDFLESIGYDVKVQVTSPITNAPPRTVAPHALSRSLAAPMFTAILTPPQFRVILRTLEQRQGVDLLSAPKVITASSHPVQIKDVSMMSIVTELEDSQNGPQPITEPFEFGPVLDAVPHVAADGYTIHMTIIPSLREFLGYDSKEPKQLPAGTPDASTITPAPIFRVRQVAASAAVFDGQTVVVGAGAVEAEDKSRPSASGAVKKIRKHLLVLVTPTIVDSAGNRVHSDEELPFRQNAIPPQKTGK